MISGNSLTYAAFIVVRARVAHSFMYQRTFLSLPFSISPSMARQASMHGVFPVRSYKATQLLSGQTGSSSGPSASSSRVVTTATNPMRP